jgi:hypothetical protein
MARRSQSEAEHFFPAAQESGSPHSNADDSGVRLQPKADQDQQPNAESERDDFPLSEDDADTLFPLSEDDADTINKLVRGFNSDHNQATRVEPKLEKTGKGIEPEAESPAALSRSVNERVRALNEQYYALKPPFNERDIGPILNELRHFEMILEEEIQRAIGEGETKDIGQIVQAKKSVDLAITDISLFVSKTEHRRKTAEQKQTETFSLHKPDLDRLTIIGSRLAIPGNRYETDSRKRKSAIKNLRTNLEDYEKELNLARGLQNKASGSDIEAHIGHLVYLISQTKTVVASLERLDEKDEIIIPPLVAGALDSTGPGEKPESDRTKTEPVADSRHERILAAARKARTAQPERIVKAAKRIRERKQSISQSPEPPASTPNTETTPPTEKPAAQIAEEKPKSTITSEKRSTKSLGRIKERTMTPSAAFEELDSQIDTQATLAIESVNRINEELRRPTAYAERERFDDALIQLSRQYADLTERHSLLSNRNLELNNKIFETKDEKERAKLTEERSANAERMHQVQDVLHVIDGARRRIQEHLKRIPESSEADRKNERPELVKLKRDRIQGVIYKLEKQLRNRGIDDPETYLGNGARRFLSALSHNWLIGGAFRNASDLHKAKIDPIELGQARLDLERIEEMDLKDRYGSPKSEAYQKARRASPIFSAPSTVNAFDIWNAAQEMLRKLGKSDAQIQAEKTELELKTKESAKRKEQKALTKSFRSRRKVRHAWSAPIPPSKLPEDPSYQPIAPALESILPGRTPTIETFGRKKAKKPNPSGKKNGK